MKSIQQMDDIIQDADSLLKEWDHAFQTENWAKVNIIKANLKSKLDKYYNRTKLQGKNWHK